MKKVGVTMRVLLNDHLYDMSRKQLDGVLKVAKKAVKRGIYAVEKNGITHMKNVTCVDQYELEIAVKAYEEYGFKVYYNE